MERTLLMTVLLIPFLGIQAQTYFYIDEIVVDPASPTSLDQIEIDLMGNLSGTGAYVVSASASVVGNTVTIAITAADNGGLTVLVPHVETVLVGYLPAGTYNVFFEAQNVGDFAPEPQHQFVVTDGDPCAALELHSVQWAAFTDTAIVVHVSNNNMVAELFDYPNFILFDSSGDTLAKETVYYFGIGEDSWHTMRVMDDAVIPGVPFTGVLELWTGFTSELACSWELPLDLCPPGPCDTMYTTLNNFGDGLAIGTFTWTLANDEGTVAEGQFELTIVDQSDQDTICVPPGQYTMVVVPDQEPTGGQLVFGVAGEGSLNGPSLFLPSGTPASLPFGFLLPCAEGSNGTGGVRLEEDLRITMTRNGVHVERLDGRAIGAIRLFDASGKLMLDIQTSAPVVLLPPLGPGIHMLYAAGRARKMVQLGN